MMSARTASPAFREGDEVVLAEGTYQGTRLDEAHMTDTIAAGSILIEEGKHLPNALLLGRNSQSNGWAALNGTRSAFEKEMREAGWTFFFMAGEIKTTVFGFNRQKRLGAALKRLIANVKSHECNSIEITQVTDKSFLKVPYVTVSAHPRHLQRGLVFAGASGIPIP